MDCPTNSSVFEDKNFSLVGESVMEWKFKTAFSVFVGFSDPLKLCLFNHFSLWFSFELSLFLFSLFIIPKSNPFSSFHSSFHSLTHATRSLCFIWFRKKGNYSSVDRFIFSHFLQLSIPFRFWSMLLNSNNIYFIW